MASRHSPANEKRLLLRPGGFTLLEILFVLAISSMLLAALIGVLRNSVAAWQQSFEEQELLNQARFAMARMVDAAGRASRIQLPLADNPATSQVESVRQLLAVTLDPMLDRDNDGFKDADNDKDGLIDEDWGSDNNNDGAAGLIGIDDNLNGLIDEMGSSDNDEDGKTGDDVLDGNDNDGDLSVDEDAPRSIRGGGGGGDDDGDGQADEDWLDTVLYHLDPSGTRLLEKMPVINPADGNDSVEETIVEAAAVELTVTRLAANGGDRYVMVRIELALVGSRGSRASLSREVRIGGRRL